MAVDDGVGGQGSAEVVDSVAFSKSNSVPFRVAGTSESITVSSAGVVVTGAGLVVASVRPAGDNNGFSITTKLGRDFVVATGGSAVADRMSSTLASVPFSVSNSSSGGTSGCFSWWMGSIVVSLTGTAEQPDQRIRHKVNTIE